MPSRGDTLLQLVYEHPEDDGARRSYADWLIEHGDLRGELIALQLARASTIAAERREIELLLEHGRSWLGRFGKHIGTYGFERGFLARCELKSVTKAMVGDPSWATVEHLELTAADSALTAAFVTHPALRALTALRGAGPLAFAELQGAGRGATLRTLHVTGAAPISLARAKSHGGLANLERLTFD